MEKNFGIEIWGEGNFFVDTDRIRIRHGAEPSLIEITQRIRAQGHTGPLLLRFPHLIAQQIASLFDAFEEARASFDYRGAFRAVFPLKVNQFPNFIESLMEVSAPYGYGLEAGSKAELIIALTHTPHGAPITVNGFKDREMIALAFVGAQNGHNITLTIEGLAELQTIIDIHKEFNQNTDTNISPNIGMRIRLHSGGVGIWAKSGGFGSKFGLTSTEILEACEMLKRARLLERFTMLHFHIGSQMGEIGPLKKALREAGNLYAELKRRGAHALQHLNIGGGLAVEYAQHSTQNERNYSLKEFANDVVFLVQEIARAKGVPEPDIFTESGRYIAANHAVLIAPVLELFSQEYHERALRLKEVNPPLVEELLDLYTHIQRTNAREYLHDALDHMESLLTLFDLGYIDLEDRSNTEILVHRIIHKAIALLGNEENDELKRLRNRIQEKYLVNFSLFQSLPDRWGLGQHFPVMPISHLDRRPTRPASIWDITCDSDGEIAFDSDRPLMLHEVDVEREEYFLAFFLTGAYQEVLGMQHNLFTHPTEATVTFDAQGAYQIERITEAKSLLAVLKDIGYTPQQLDAHPYATDTAAAHAPTDSLRTWWQQALRENGYLKTIQSTQENLS